MSSVENVGVDIIITRPSSSIFDAVEESQFNQSKLRQKTYPQGSEIDWLHEYQKDRHHSKILLNDEGVLRKLYTRGVHWLVIIVSAVLIGLTVSIIDGSSIWVNDLRNGYCRTEFFSTKLRCCEESVEGTKCDNWHDWDFNSNSFGHFLGYVLSSSILSVLGCLITKKAPMTSRSGIGEIKVILSGLVFDEFLSFKNLVVKTSSLILVVGAGLWIGKEGPLVHVSGCIMAIISTLLDFDKSPNEALKRELLSASVAAGIAVAFNAPIGGVLFIIEQDYKNLKINNIMWKSFICATISVIVLQNTHPVFSLDTHSHLFNTNKDWLSIEIFPFMILGMFGGVYGATFSKFNLYFAKLRSLKNRNPLIEILVLSFITAILTYPLVFGKLPLSILITRLFRDCESSDNAHNVIGALCSSDPFFQTKPFFLLLFTGLIGFVLSSYTYGTLLPGGVLMPSLAIGACFGRSMGLIIDFFQVHNPHLSIFSNCPSYSSPEEVATSKCISTGAYAIIGAGSFLAGITKTTVSVVVIMFELTGALTYVLPIMISVLISKVVNDNLILKNVYELWLDFKKLFILNQNIRNFASFPPIPVSNILTYNVDENSIVYSSSSRSFTSLENTVQEIANFNDNTDKPSHILGIPVLLSPDSPVLQGWIPIDELYKEIDNIKQIPAFNNDQPISFNLNDTTNNFFSQIRDFEVSDDEEERDNLTGISSNNGSSLSLSHLIEFCGNLAVLKDTLPLVVVVDMFYKLNHNVILFINDHGEYKGVVNRYKMIELVEGGVNEEGQ